MAYDEGLAERIRDVLSVRDDIGELKTNMAGRDNSLENDRVSKKEFEAVKADINAVTERVS